MIYYKCLKGVDMFGNPDYDAVIDRNVTNELGDYLSEKGFNVFQITKISRDKFKSTIECNEFTKILSLLNNSVLITNNSSVYNEHTSKKILFTKRKKWNQIADDLAFYLLDESRKPEQKAFKNDNNCQAIIDECVNYNFANYLKKIGFNVYSILKNNRGITDYEVARITYEKNSILITCDKPFYERFNGLKVLYEPKFDWFSMVKKIYLEINKA